MYTFNFRKKCFTLIEMLIAVTIISVIMLSIYSAFSTGILSYKRIDSSFDVYQNARTVFSRLEVDLKNSFAYTTDGSYFKGESQELDFFNIPDTYDKDNVYSNVCRIKYTFQDQVLKRAAYPLILALDENSSPIIEDVCDRVKSISFQYAYKSDNNQEPYLWQDSWPGVDIKKSQLPLAVKIKLSLVEKNKTGLSAPEFTKLISLTQETAMIPKDEKKQAF